MFKDIFTAVADDVVKRILGVVGTLTLLVLFWVPPLTPLVKRGPRNVQEAYSAWFIFLALSFILIFKPSDEDDEEIEYWGEINGD